LDPCCLYIGHNGSLWRKAYVENKQKVMKIMEKII